MEGGGLRRFADYIKIQSWFTTSCKEKALSSHVSSFWDQRLGAVIYSTLSETPLPGGRVIVCMQMLIILSCPEFGMWIIPPVQWRSRREEREGRNWNSSSAPHPPTSQPLAPVIFSAMKLKMSLYWRRPASEYIGILSLSLQSTQLKMLPTNGRDTSVLQIFNNPQSWGSICLKPTKKKSEQQFSQTTNTGSSINSLTA